MSSQRFSLSRFLFGFPTLTQTLCNNSSGYAREPKLILTQERGKSIQHCHWVKARRMFVGQMFLMLETLVPTNIAFQNKDKTIHSIHTILFNNSHEIKSFNSIISLTVFHCNVYFTTKCDHWLFNNHTSGSDNKAFPQKKAQPATPNVPTPRSTVIFSDEWSRPPRTKRFLRVNRPVDGPHSITVESRLWSEEPARSSAVLLLR